jgi:hypothetical protein
MTIGRILYLERKKGKGDFTKVVSKSIEGHKLANPSTIDTAYRFIEEKMGQWVNSEADQDEVDNK